MRRCLAFVALSILAGPLGWLGPEAQAQTPAAEYPDRPIRVIVPYAAGGATDSVARMVGQKMSEALGQPVVIENRAGADGNIGAEAVARSTPDGYTLLMGDIGNLTLGPAMRRSVPYDAVRDFAPISQLISAPNVMAVHPSIPASTLAEFVAYAKARPGKLSYASSGTGGSAHLAGELLKRAVGIDMVHVPYKGGSAAILDVVRGDVPIMFGLSPVLPQVRDGKLKAIVVTSTQRIAVLPQVPTVAELGHPGFEATAWYGLLAPAGTPAPIISRLHRVALLALQSPDVKRKLEAAGNQIVGSSPDEFATYIKSEKAKWSEVVATAGIKVE